MTKKNEIEINGEVYIKKSEVKDKKSSWITKNKEGKTMCMIRTYSSGVHYGYVDLKSENSFLNVEVIDSRRIRYWQGALSLSELSQEGSTSKDSCKLCIKVPVIYLERVIEKIPMAKKAIENLDSIANHEV